MTRQQQIISDIITNSTEHMNADEIYLAAKAVLPKISVGTVYRNLIKFEEDGLIKRVCVSGCADRFDKNTHEHAHAVCTCCGKIIDVPTKGIKQMLQSTTDIDIISMDINLKYICENCKNEKSNQL